MQKLFIAGTIGKDAEVRYTKGNGDAVASFSVAVDNGKDKQGNKRDATWFDCSVWGKRGESLAPYLKKGGSVSIIGRPTAREYNGKVYLGVNVDEITLQGGNSKSNNSNTESYSSGSSQSVQDDMNDEIPFS